MNGDTRAQSPPEDERSENLGLLVVEGAPSPAHSACPPQGAKPGSVLRDLWTQRQRFLLGVSRARGGVSLPALGVVKPGKRFLSCGGGEQPFLGTPFTPSPLPLLPPSSIRPRGGRGGWTPGGNGALAFPPVSPEKGEGQSPEPVVASALAGPAGQQQGLCDPADRSWPLASALS